MATPFCPETGKAHSSLTSNTRFCPTCGVSLTATLNDDDDGHDSNNDNQDDCYIIEEYQSKASSLNKHVKTEPIFKTEQPPRKEQYVKTEQHLVRTEPLYDLPSPTRASIIPGSRTATPGQSSIAMKAGFNKSQVEKSRKTAPLFPKTKTDAPPPRNTGPSVIFQVSRHFWRQSPEDKKLTGWVSSPYAAEISLENTMMSFIQLVEVLAEKIQENAASKKIPSFRDQLTGSETLNIVREKPKKDALPIVLEGLSGVHKVSALAECLPLVKGSSTRIAVLCWQDFSIPEHAIQDNLSERNIHDDESLPSLTDLFSLPRSTVSIPTISSYASSRGMAQSSKSVVSGGASFEEKTMKEEEIEDWTKFINTSMIDNIRIKKEKVVEDINDLVSINTTDEVAETLEPTAEPAAESAAESAAETAIELEKELLKKPAKQLVKRPAKKPAEETAKKAEGKSVKKLTKRAAATTAAVATPTTRHKRQASKAPEQLQQQERYTDGVYSGTRSRKR